MKKSTSSSSHDKSLYICCQLTEYGLGRGASKTSWHIHALNLSHLLLPSPANSSSSSSIDTKLLRTVTRISSVDDHDLPDRPCCGVFGSKILFAGSRDPTPSRQVSVFEIDPRVDSKLTCFPSFVNGNERALLMELDDGKLYAVRCSWHYKLDYPHPPLMAFDPTEGIWSALPYPPLPRCFRWRDVCCATVGTDILVSLPRDLDDHKVLYCFDTAARRWTRHSTVDRLMSSGGRAVVLNCEDGFIIFTHSCTRDWDDRMSDWDSIQVYHMSKEYEHLRHIESHQMPHHDQFPPARQGGSDNSYFVHLGGRQVCLVLGSQIWQRGEGDRLTIVVVMFEYAMADQKKKKKKSPISEFNFLTTRLFKFDHLNPHRTGAEVLGAFLVPPPQPAPVVLPNT